MGNIASFQISGKSVKTAKNSDGVYLQKFTTISSDIMHEKKTEHPRNALAQKQGSSLEKSYLNRNHGERSTTASSASLGNRSGKRTRHNREIDGHSELSSQQERKERLLVKKDEEIERYGETLVCSMIRMSPSSASVRGVGSAPSEISMSPASSPSFASVRGVGSASSEISSVFLEEKSGKHRRHRNQRDTDGDIGWPPKEMKERYRPDDQERTYKEHYEQQIADLEAKAQQLREERDRLLASSGSTENLKGSVKLKKDYKKRITSLEAEVQQLKEEKHKLFTRLSEIGAVRLTENNPNIADLSDANRPEKVAEQFSELYDNEWTDAFEYLTQTKGWQDEETVRRLLSILQKIYRECLEYTRKRTEDLTKAILSYLGLSEENTNDFAIKETEKRLREYRAAQFEPALARVAKDVRHQFKDELEGKVHGTLDKYIQKCTRICWFMGIKDPQMHLDFEQSQTDGSPDNDVNDLPFHFDTTKFVSYTRAGMYMEFVVWPAVYLYKDGPLIKRGVAQGLNRKQEAEESAVDEKGGNSDNNGENNSIYADQGHYGDNSDCEFTQITDEDTYISHGVSCTDAFGQVTVNGNTQNFHSLDISGRDLSVEKQGEFFSDQNVIDESSDENYGDKELSNRKRESEENENFQEEDASHKHKPIYNNEGDAETSVLADSDQQTAEATTNVTTKPRYKKKPKKKTS